MKISTILHGVIMVWLTACSIYPGTSPQASLSPTTKNISTSLSQPSSSLPPTLPEVYTATPGKGRSDQTPQVVIPPDRPIQLPPGFAISVFMRGLHDPRMQAIGPDGLLYVAERGAGRVIRLPDRNQDGSADGIEVVADGLDHPNSLAFFQDGSLYVAETTRVWRLSRPDPQGVFQDKHLLIDGLPNGGHATRTLLFSPDWSTLFVSIGSSCNVCIESDNRRATIMAYKPDGSGGQIYASGLRNAVGITFRPGTQELWATNNGRDYLGDSLPPETVYQVLQGKNYGWPFCYAGRIIDPQFGNANSCQGVETPKVEMAAHMAPLGLTFYNGTAFPPAYQGSLFIALHGSWNSSVPIGYKIMRVPISGGVIGKAEDFATGWLGTDHKVWGRPADVISAPDGGLYISDDSAGIIYRIFYQG